MIHTRILKALSLCSIATLFVFTNTIAQTEVSMIFVGDVMQHDGQIEAARKISQ